MRNMWKLGQNFWFDARKLIADCNYRLDLNDDELQALAESIAKVGQLHAVQVFWTGRALAVAAGYRTVEAVKRYAADYGLDGKVSCRLVEAEMAPILRLHENSVRRDPTTYETARYLYQLHTGTYAVLEGQPRRQYSIAELASGSSYGSRYIQLLVQFWRELPDEVKKAWGEDKDGKLTRHQLANLVRLKNSGGDVGAALAALLGQPSPAVEAEPAPLAASFAAALGGVADALASAGTSAQPSSSSAKPEPTEAPIRAQRLGRPQARRLHKQFIKLVGQPVAQNDWRGRLVAGILGGIAGEVSFGEVERLVLDVARQIRGDD